MTATAEFYEAKQRSQLRQLVNSVWLGTVGTQSEGGHAYMTEVMEHLEGVDAADARLSDDDQRLMFMQMMGDREVSFSRVKVDPASTGSDE